MNRKLFQQVSSYAEAMMTAAEADDDTRFYHLYAELLHLCEENAGTKADHPVLWETLADFTESNTEAIRLYRLAYQLAVAQKDNEYKASIQYSLAVRMLEENEVESAIEALLKAEKFAGFTEDETLREDIAGLKKKVSKLG